MPPSNHPYVSPFWYGRNGPNNSQIVIFGPLTSTHIKADEVRSLYIWWHGLWLFFMGVLPQCHDKVISRSNRLILIENDTLFSISLCSKWWNTVIINPLYIYTSYSENMRVSVPTTTIYKQTGAFTEGYGTMARAWHFVTMSLPAMRFRIPLGAEWSCSPSLNLGTVFRGCVLGQGTWPENAFLTYRLWNLNQVK